MTHGRIAYGWSDCTEGGSLEFGMAGLTASARDTEPSSRASLHPLTTIHAMNKFKRRPFS